jgi:hypothetical protein
MDEIDDAWRVLRGGLRSCCDARRDEVSRYPTPIARCDVQLAWVIERRDAAFALLREAERLDGLRDRATPGRWRRDLRRFAAAMPDLDEPPLAAARDRLLAVLAE